MDEYSILYPATISASASGKSNGARLVSAKSEINNKTALGSIGDHNQTDCPNCTKSNKLNDPDIIIKGNNNKPIETS